MVTHLEIRIGGTDQDVAAVLVATGASARDTFVAAAAGPGVQLLLAGERDYHVELSDPSAEARAAWLAVVGQRVELKFAGRRTRVRRVLAEVGGIDPVAALALTGGMHGADPLYLHADGQISDRPEGPAPRGRDALAAVVAAARWISTRRTTSFECLFPASPFHPEEPVRDDRLTVAQGQVLLDQMRAVVAAAAPGGADVDPLVAAQLRSGVLTVLSHIVATVLRDPEFRGLADAAVAEIFALIAGETQAGGRPELRAHAISLLSMRGPALQPQDQARATELLRGLRRSAPPYAELTGTWRFAMNSADEFYPGEVKILQNLYRFTLVETPEDAPASPTRAKYQVLRAPFLGPAGQVIEVYARPALPRDENHEMGSAYFTGVMISRHANLGAYDMRAALVNVEQVGYKLMMNGQCAGLTTRFAISRMFPDADIYSSWDSTYFRTDGHETNASEAMDCFVALLQGMAAGEDFAAIDKRLRKAQWHHAQSRTPGFVQFIGPAHPLVVARYEDINHDGKADFYDGFLDFKVVEIYEAVHDSATPKDPGAAASQIAGEAARGLHWAAGSLNRVTQYSELWATLPGQAASFYIFRSGGFHDPAHPPGDVPAGTGPAVDLGLAPAVTRYLPDPSHIGGMSAEVSLHAWLSHSAQELKRLLVAAEAFWRAVDLGYLAVAPMTTPGGQRAALLLLLAGLLEFPADPNRIDGYWESALDMLQLPRISRSLVRRCIDAQDHNRSNYYGSRRGVVKLIGTPAEPGGAIHAASPVTFDEIVSDDPQIGRPRALRLTAAE